MACSSQTGGPYDVFLSFRGPDVRTTIISHLYRSLDQKGINTFKDDETLEKGGQVSSALPNTIRNSRIAVIVFSQNFASSSWCLDEVATIMDCKKTKKLIVLPVFYYVDPREVRNPRDIYKEAFIAHKKKYDSDKVTTWREALKDAANLYGSEFNAWVVKKPTKEESTKEEPAKEESKKEDPIQLESREFKFMKKLGKETPIRLGSVEFKDEADLVESIVRDIWIRLNHKPLKVANFPVGIDSRVKKLIAELKMESQEVLTMGLWSMGGMGKTTLARALYNSIFENFEGSAYVDGVKGTLQETRDMVRLQKRLLSQMLMTENIKLTSDAQGSNMIAKRLGHKRVLLILDNVDDICQIDCLAMHRRLGEGSWFGEGSRIIITTTDEGLLSTIEASIHRVQPLDDSEARELFMEHAGNKKGKIGRDFVDRVLECTQCLPLALVVLGRAFAASELNEWKAKLDEFSKRSDKSIDDVLKISYDGLNDNDQQIFLHIACFFNGWSRRYVEGVLTNCDLSVVTGVHRLIRRSLITDENGTLKVHDLIELMGKNIAKRECPGSRLWELEDVSKVLSQDKGTEVVEAIVLAPPNQKTINIRSEDFAKLERLKFLIMINVKAGSQDPICLPEELKWFEWPECPASCLTLTSPGNLAVLAVRKHLFKEPEET